MSPQTEPQDQWYVMRDLKRPNARIRAYQQLSESGLVVFTPMVTRVADRYGKRVRETVPFISDLLFVYATRAILDPVVDRIDTLQYRYVKGGGYCEPLGRIVINLCLGLCLGVYFAESEDEEFGVVDAVQFSSECLDFGVDGFCRGVCRAVVVEVEDLVRVFIKCSCYGVE